MHLIIVILLHTKFVGKVHLSFEIQQFLCNIMQIILQSPLKSLQGSITKCIRNLVFYCCSQYKNCCISKLRWTFPTNLVCRSITMIRRIDLARFQCPDVRMFIITHPNVSEPPEFATPHDFFAQRFIYVSILEIHRILRILPFSRKTALDFLVFIFLINPQQGQFLCSYFIDF